MANLRRSARALALILAAALAACSSPTNPGDGGDASRVDARGDGATTDMGTGDALDARGDGNACVDGSMCGAACADLQTDPAHCGACAHDCTHLPGVSATDVRCVAGACSLTGACQPGRAHCSSNPDDGCEVDATTPTNCGACGVACAEPTPVCSADSTGAYHCSSGCGGTTPTRCGAMCVDTQTNPQFCGGCSTVCPAVTNGHATCASGTCGAACDSGFHLCNSMCVPDTDASACGASCMACSAPANAIATCTSGACSFECNANFADCDHMAANGCEVDTRVTATACGACGTVCTAANGTAGCAAGVCTVAACDTGFADCDSNAMNGCEVNTATSPTDCGGCGMACTTTNGSAGCAASMCTIASCNAGFADCDLMVANGCEVNTRTSVTDCGTCASACTTANGVPTCSTGVCAIASCNMGFADCNGSATDGCEADLGTSPSHCGTCANACAVPNATAGCAAGMCTVASCNTGFRDCNAMAADGCEVDINTNPLSCGACGNICFIANGAAACIAGTCAVAACAPGYADCDGLPANGCEANFATDPRNCAACGTVCSSPNATSSCTSGVCGIGTCNTGFADCDSASGNGCEVDTRTSTSNCGSCGNVCFAANASSTCVAGACAIGTCNTNFADCDGMAANGCEANLQSSVSSCGTCGRACTAANGLGGCVSGSCTIASCSAGFADCNRMIPDGCEVSTNTDPMNCGSCGFACVVPNATPACAGGMCVIGSCNAGFADCDGNPANGCETNLNTSIGNCGMCGRICSTGGGTPVCNAGTCGISSCASGFGDCNMSAGDGCETNTNTSVTNCGACGNVCAAPNGTAGCSSGACNVASCNPGFANCNVAPGDGCETNLNTNVSSCGSCGRVCTVPNGTPGCVTGNCAIATCNAGFANCNGTVADGCEINTRADANNCGGCGIRCAIPNGTPSCTAGVCTIGTCNPGFADCDGNPANGCETSTAADPNNCGVCRRTCSVANGTPACTAGNCVIASCAAGWSNCNGAYADGCEIHTSVDPNHCGSCTTACSNPHGTTTCTAGTCGVGSCSAGYGNCNGTAADGCETDLSISPTNCGSCGNSCTTACMVNGVRTTAAACTAGACRVTGCGAMYYDIDGVCGSGCECASNGAGGTCGAPRTLGTVAIGGSTGFSGNLVPTGADAYFQVSFTGNASGAYHPRIRFTLNPNSEFKFDLLSGCAGTTFTCGVEGGNSTSLTDWEMFFAGVDSTRFATPLPAITAIIHVYRRPGAMTTCNNFGLLITN